jgi:hypothetical protein
VLKSQGLFNGEFSLSAGKYLMMFIRRGGGRHFEEREEDWWWWYIEVEEDEHPKEVVLGERGSTSFIIFGERGAFWWWKDGSDADGKFEEGCVSRSKAKGCQRMMVVFEDAGTVDWLMGSPPTTIKQLASLIFVCGTAAPQYG